jgi:hypothetical protein
MKDTFHKFSVTSKVKKLLQLYDHEFMLKLLQKFLVTIIASTNGRTVKKRENMTKLKLNYPHPSFHVFKNCICAWLCHSSQRGPLIS